MPHPGFFDIDRRLESISRMGDPLERLATEIPWELFRELLEQVHEKDRKSAAGRKPLDVVLMFKVLILQSLYNLSDEQVAEMQKIRDGGGSRQEMMGVLTEEQRDKLLQLRGQKRNAQPRPQGGSA